MNLKSIVPRLSASVAVLTAASCATPVPYRAVIPVVEVPDNLPVEFYAVVVHTEVQSGEDDGAHMSRFTNDAARRRVKNATTVGFVPPTVCRDLTQQDSSTTGTATLASMSCSLLLSRLEDAASLAGYDVVSSQVFRTAEFGGSAGYLGSARAMGVDVIFEVSQWTLEDREGFSERTTTMTPYHRRFEPNSKEELKDALRRLQRSYDPTSWERIQHPMDDAWKATYERCGDMMGTTRKVADKGEASGAARLTLKAVDAASGKSLWFYSNLADADETVEKGDDIAIFAEVATIPEDKQVVDYTSATCKEFYQYMTGKYGRGGSQMNTSSANMCRFRGGTGFVGDYRRDPTPEEELAAKGQKMRTTAGTVALYTWFTGVGGVAGIVLAAISDARIRKWNRLTADAKNGPTQRVEMLSTSLAETHGAQEVLCNSAYYLPQAEKEQTRQEPQMGSGYQVTSGRSKGDGEKLRAEKLVQISADDFRKELPKK